MKVASGYPRTNYAPHPRLNSILTLRLTKLLFGQIQSLFCDPYSGSSRLILAIQGGLDLSTPGENIHESRLVNYPMIASAGK